MRDRPKFLKVFNKLAEYNPHPSSNLCYFGNENCEMFRDDFDLECKLCRLYYEKQRRKNKKNI